MKCILDANNNYVSGEIPLLHPKKGSHEVLVAPYVDLAAAAAAGGSHQHIYVFDDTFFPTLSIHGCCGCCC
jgi:hypothetical protein